MCHNNPWQKLYENWPARNDKEAKALELLAMGRVELIVEETGMSSAEYKSFMQWAREYESTHLCIEGPRRE